MKTGIRKNKTEKISDDFQPRNEIKESIIIEEDPLEYNLNDLKPKEKGKE